MDSVRTTMTAMELVAALQSRRISAVELVELHLSQIERHNARLNAIVIENYAAARAAAQAADQARAKGDERPLLGLPMTVKDWIDVEGLRSTAGDAGLAAGQYVAKADARVIGRLKGAGAIILGKTNMAPWGGDWTTDNPVFGRSNNPWNVEYTPGGSTGGGAAAVAAGLSALEIGNDIGGSVRIPPAFCGIYGHKPSESAWARSGQVPDGSGLHLPNPATGLAMMGPLARSADDLTLAFDLACGPDQGEEAAWKLEIPPARHTRLQDFRVAVMPALDWVPVDSELVAAQERLVGELSRLGCRVQTILPEGFGDLKEFHNLYHRLLIVNITLGMPKEQRHEVAEWAHKASQERGDELIEIGAQAFEAGAHDFIYWYGSREHYRMLFRQFFNDWDVLLTPVTFTPAFRHSERPADADMDELMLTMDGQPVHYRNMGVHPALATLCGQPATAFPVGISSKGLPLALQVIGPYLEDHTPLKFASLVAQVTGGYQVPPGIQD